MLVPRMDLCLAGSSKILLVAPCQTAKSSRYELLIPEFVRIDNLRREREKLKELVNVNVNSSLNRSSL